jgi:Fatty acid desaturase
MKLHPEELNLARVYEQQLPFEPLSREQIHSIMTRGRELHRWFKNHRATHCLISLAVLTFLLGGDYLVLLRLPAVWLHPGRQNSWGPILLAGVVCGVLHCWLMYSLGTYTLHEGAAHKIIFPPLGPISRLGHFLSVHLGRVAGGVPPYYADVHMAHHAKFGTTEDSEFLNFVTPRRYWLTFLPLAVILNYSDFVVHRPLAYTRSRVVTLFVAFAYHGLYTYLIFQSWGRGFTLLVLLLFTHLGFYLDRLRQFTEHNLMPLDNLNGSRSLGMGFWGMLVGAGPWGSPCHWEHHLVASVPWYQQLLLHRHVVRLLTPRQRQQFLIVPLIGFPRLWWRILRESYALMRATSPTESASLPSR